MFSVRSITWESHVQERFSCCIMRRSWRLRSEHGMCPASVNTVHNGLCICITNNLTTPFGGPLWMIKHFYHKLQTATLCVNITDLAQMVETCFWTVFWDKYHSVKHRRLIHIKMSFKSILCEFLHLYVKMNKADKEVWLQGSPANEKLMQGA